MSREPERRSSLHETISAAPCPTWPGNSEKLEVASQLDKGIFAFRNSGNGELISYRGNPFDSAAHIGQVSRGECPEPFLGKTIDFELPTGWQQCSLLACVLPVQAAVTPQPPRPSVSGASRLGQELFRTAHAGQNCRHGDSPVLLVLTHMVQQDPAWGHDTSPSAKSFNRFSAPARLVANVVQLRDDAT